YPVGAGGGSTDVFWRDAQGDLWMEQLMSWGSAMTRQRLAGAATADPSAVSAGDGSADVFWRGGDGGLWHLRVVGTRAGAPASLASQAMLGRPTVVEPSPGRITLVLQRGDQKLATVLGLPGIGWVGPELLG